MKTISLISLIVEYEVPPHLIIEAIKDGRLRPLAVDSEVKSLDEIAFSEVEARNLFWSYELKFKSAEEKAALTLRLQRYDAIKSGIISAVVAAGVVGLVSAVSSIITKASGGNKQSSGAPMSLRSPLDRPPALFHLQREPHAVLISLRSQRIRRFTLRAVSDGIVERYSFAPIAGHVAITIRHGPFWLSQYYLESGILQQPVGDFVRVGNPIVTILDDNEVRRKAGFMFWNQQRPLVAPAISRLDLIPWSELSSAPDGDNSLGD